MTQAVPRNLVSMDDHAKALRGMSPREAVRLLHHCRDAALEGLSEAFSCMVAQADDVLFDLAQKGENDAIQSAYFDAMRRLRLVRAEMAETFAKRLEESCSLHIGACIPCVSGLELQWLLRNQSRQYLPAVNSYPSGCCRAKSSSKAGSGSASLGRFKTSICERPMPK